MLLVASLLIGFSVVAAAISLFAYLFFLPHMQKTRLSQGACVALALALSILQCGHWWALHTGASVLDARWYVLCLMAAPTGFFFFSRAILTPDRPLGTHHVLNLLPLALPLVLPLDTAVLIAFVVGALYTLWFLNIVWGLRRHAARFRFELFFFGLFALLAIGTMAAVFLVPATGERPFVLAYASSIGLAYALIIAALMCFPDLLSDLVDTARLSYANTTLRAVDVENKAAALDRLMQSERLFVNEELNLAMTAQAVDLTPHQLSELINTRFGHGFSRYIREQRVAYAKSLLLADPAASVLSVGMSAGFRSQSNFYTAFKSVTGQTPGQFRSAQSNSA